METGAELSPTELIERIKTDLDSLGSLGLSFRQPAALVSVLEAGPVVRAKLDSVLSLTAAEV